MVTETGDESQLAKSVLKLDPASKLTAPTAIAVAADIARVLFPLRSPPPVNGAVVEMVLVVATLPAKALKSA